MRFHSCLNGLWDFAPYESDDNTVHKNLFFPSDAAWQHRRIVVPGSWTRGGAVYADRTLRQCPWLQGRIYDNFGYPAHWDAMNTAWYRRAFDLPDAPVHTRWRLRFGGILRQAWIVVNGHTAACSSNGILPVQADISSCVRERDNELVVYVTDYERDEHGRAFTPVGSDQMVCQKGIWQDVWLEGMPALHIEDCTIRTCIRGNTLWIRTVCRNETPRAQTLHCAYVIWDQARRVHSFDGGTYTVAPHRECVCTTTHRWSSYTPWSPEHPHLYTLEVHLVQEKNTVDRITERFGFREVWVQDHHLMLNGYPVHLRGEWCHKHTLENFRPEYIGQWYGMLKDMHMNYIRTHTFPHPRILLDMADEMGILVSVEAGWQFGDRMALDKKRFWINAMAHVRAIVARDKNHPAVILWSVANETRWCHNRRAVRTHLPTLRRLYERLDPTRIPYHEGDSSLWDERTQHIISRHYGVESTGEDWWDKSRPLHVGELGKWHYGQPVDNTVWGNEDVFASFRACHTAIAREAADCIRQARANEVACVFPWNISGLDNYRPSREEKSFSWSRLDTPYVKPLRSGAYATEFRWWDPDTRGYVPGPGFEIVRNALAPCILVVREKQNAAIGGTALSHTVTCVNDTTTRLRGRVYCRLYYAASSVWTHEEDVDIPRGHTHRIVCRIGLPATSTTVAASIETRFIADGRCLASHTRQCRVVSASVQTRTWNIGSCAVYGSGACSGVLDRHGVKTIPIARLEDADPAGTPLLLIEKDSIESGTTQHRALHDFLQRGGRAVVLEQRTSVFPAMALEHKPVQQCHIRGGHRDVLSGFSDRDFGYWGADPYGRTDADSCVTIMPYRKPACGMSRVLVDAGWGDFGHGGLLWAPLVQTWVGRGMAFACQVCLDAHVHDHPVALRLLETLLVHADRFTPPAWREAAAFDSRAQAFLHARGCAVGHPAEVVCATGDCSEDAAAQLCERARSGATVLISGLSADALRHIAFCLEIDLRPSDTGTHYHLVKKGDDALLDGISNQELYWLDHAHYGPPDTHNRPMTDILIDTTEAQVLLHSEAESCWREFYTKGAKSERYRMAAVTHLLKDGPRPVAAGLVRIPAGTGQLLLCQVPFVQDTYEKACVFWTHILTSLGIRSTRSLLDGETTVAGDRHSEGYPSYVRLRKNVTDKECRRICAYACPSEHRFPNHALTDAFVWEKADTGNAEVVLPAYARNAVIWYEVCPGSPRLARREDGGLPDPHAQTRLDIETCGRIVVYINGERYVETTCVSYNRITVADIELDAAWNTVIIVWEPPQEAPLVLRMRWRTREGHAETGFRFDSDRAV
jgi:hypothetical protein